jgi:tetratricopeptide (TPR) repeat protein
MLRARAIHASLAAAAALLLAPPRGRAEPVVLDPAVSARYAVVPDVADWRPRLYKDKDFDGVERFVADHLKSMNDVSSDELTRFYEALATIEEDFPASAMEAVLLEWTRARPESHAARMALGHFHLHHAWSDRGPGETKAEALRAYGEKLEQSQRELEAAYAMEPKDPGAAELLINVARARALPRERMEDYYRKALAAYPGHHGARYNKLAFISPRLYGSKDDVEAFGRQCLKDSALYPYAGRLAIDVLNDRAAGGAVLKPNELWLTVKVVYEGILARYPDDLHMRARFAFWACRSKRDREAAEQFDAIGDRWVQDTNWDSLTEYNEARAHAYGDVAYSFTSRNEWGKAKPWLDKMLTYAPRDVWGLMMTAKYWQETGDANLAVDYAQKALALHPAPDSEAFKWSTYIVQAGGRPVPR